MKIETSVVRKIGWLIIGLLSLFLAWCSTRATKSSAPRSPAPPETRGSGGGIGGVPAHRAAHIRDHFLLDPRRALAQRTIGLGDSCAPLSTWIE